MAATLRDVAKACGVDVSTVSRALRGDVRVAEETALRVRAAAERLDYRPNLAARGLQAGATRTVWFIAGSLDGVNERRLASEAGKVLAADGYDLLYASFHGDPTAYERLLGRIDQGLADAVLIVAGGAAHPDSPALRQLLARRFPLLFLDRSPGWADVPTVTTDNAAATRELVQRLAAAGVRQLVVTEGDGNDVATLRRETALQEGRRLGLSACTADRFVPGAAGAVGVFGSSQGAIHTCCTSHATALRGRELRFACFDAWTGEPYPAPEALVAEQDFPGMARRAADRLLAMIGDPTAWSGMVDRLPVLGIRAIHARL